VTEACRERRRSALELTKNAFNGISISVVRYLKSEAGWVECRLEVLSAIDEKFGGFDVVSVAEFAQENFGERGCRG